MTDKRAKTSSDPAPDAGVLYGAVEIAKYLGCTPRRVYHANEVASGMPLRKRPGLGMYAIKSELDAWLRAPESLL